MLLILTSVMGFETILFEFEWRVESKRMPFCSFVLIHLFSSSVVFNQAIVWFAKSDQKGYTKSKNLSKHFSLCS